jgi:hypothetical protein
VEIKNQVQISKYCEINPNSNFKRNSNFWSSFAENSFSFAIRCNKELVSQISSKSKVPSLSSEFSLVFDS